MRRGLIVAAALLAACAPASVSASPAPTAVSVAPTVAPTATVAPSPSTAPSPGLARYTSAELGYTVDLPPGWRRAICSVGIWKVSPLQSSDFFVSMPEAEETLGMGLHAVTVRVEQAEGRTPLAWLEAGNVAGEAPLRHEAATVDGRPGARAVVAASGETIAFVVAARGWVYAIDKGGPRDAATDAEMSRILSTLRILDDATLGRGVPTPAPRTAESLVASLVNGFARKDVAALTELMTPCITVGAIPGDGASRSRVAYAKDLSTQLESSVTVRVQSQIETDPGYGRYVRSIWSRAGQPDQRIDLVIKADGERWSWSSSLVRAP